MSQGMDKITTVLHVTIDPDSPRPVYLQVADVIRHRINTGTITRRVPSIRDLVGELGVSQGSVVHALEVLTAEGVIFPVRGKGYYVAERPPEQG